MYEKRFYRDYMTIESYVKFTVVEKESDLQFIARKNLYDEALDSIRKYRKMITDYIARDKSFLTSLCPIEISEHAPEIVRQMGEAAFKAGVGPMAAVAGAISEYVCRDLLHDSDEILAENGGDIYMNFKSPKKVLVYAGNSPFSNKLAVNIPAELMPLGVCTSAGTVGHSLSFGKADAVMVLSKDTLLADAAATSIGNKVKSASDISSALEYARTIDDIIGVLIIIGDKMGAWGEISLCSP
ncbi:MAG: UPF0280 family protein [Bacillota bacterium]|nr:UPF0280 family protein [Bacillota bacterium]